MVKLYLIFLLSLFCYPTQDMVQEPQDSVIVVKGQVSDYYITVKKKRNFAQDRLPGLMASLLGATIMFQYSPVHDNTDINGMFCIMDGVSDSVLVVYYPKMEMAYVNVKGIGNTVNVKLNPPKLVAVKNEKAQSTAWFDPQSDHPKTFCNPVDISYNF